MTSEDFAASVSDRLRRRGVHFRKADLDAFASGIAPQIRLTLDADAWADRFLAGVTAGSLPLLEMKGQWERILSSSMSLAVGVGAAPVALVIAVLAAGAGHGTYLPTVVLFPYLTLSRRLYQNPDTYMALALVLPQFPLYGAILAYGGWARRFWPTASGLLLVHVASVVLCFLFPPPGGF